MHGPTPLAPDAPKRSDQVIPCTYAYMYVLDYHLTWRQRGQPSPLLVESLVELKVGSYQECPRSPVCCEQEVYTISHRASRGVPLLTTMYEQNDLLENAVPAIVKEEQAARASELSDVFVINPDPPRTTPKS